MVVTGSIAVRDKGRHLPGWSSEEDSDSEDPSFNGLHKTASAAATHTRTRGKNNTSYTYDRIGHY